VRSFEDYGDISVLQHSVLQHSDEENNVMVSVFCDDRFLAHQTGAFHPESPDRILAIRSAIDRMPLSDCITWHTPSTVDLRSPDPWIGQVHDLSYVDSLRQLCSQGGGFVDGDTPVSPQSYDVASLAVNAWLDGVDGAKSGSPCFVVARPPGHHALRDRGMGFCLLNHGAIAAHYALDQGCDRVAILDWDVHHGNGTQAIVETHPQIAYCSLHEFPHYPGTGLATETGEFNNVLNVPMKAQSDGADYDRAFTSQVMPFLRSFNPDLLIVSAGYDAAAADPLSNINLIPADYGRMTRSLLSLTRSIVFGLEGGYDLEALGQCVVATIEACLEDEDPSNRLR
jgi:acetoin utilization deacetylase AcuC-like enzyme